MSHKSEFQKCAERIKIEERDMDLEYTHARLMAALKGIAAGKRLGDTASVPPFGTSTKIVTALNDAKRLNETYAADDLDLVDQACKALGVTRTSDKKNEVAFAILTALQRRRAR